MSHIFISYSRRNKGYAYKLADDLEGRGFPVWIDRRIEPGNEWPRLLQEKLNSCVVFIIIMSSQAYASDWVQNELNRAKRKNKIILPLLLEGDPWLSLETIQYSDVRDDNLPLPSFYSLCASISRLPPHSQPFFIIFPY